MNTTYNTGLLQAKAYRHLKNYLSTHLVQYQLSMPEWAFLGTVYDKGEMRLAEIATILDVEAPFATNLADTLQKKGFIKRKEDLNDRRAKVISLTSLGKKRVPQIEEETKGMMRQIIAGITPDELVIYLKVLGTIVHNYSSLPRR